MRAAIRSRRQPGEERQSGDADLQHRARRGKEMHREIRVVLPIDDANRERRRRGRPEDQRDVDDRGGERQNGEHGRRIWR